jgi:hypothetical protein
MAQGSDICLLLTGTAKKLCNAALSYLEWVN